MFANSLQHARVLLIMSKSASLEEWFRRAGVAGEGELGAGDPRAGRPVDDAPGDHAAAKRIIGTTKTMTPEEAADPAFDLRGLAKR